MGLVFELTDLRGQVLAEFEHRSDAEVTVGRNQISTAKLTVPAADERSLCQPLRTRLRVYLDGVPIVNGPATPSRNYHQGRVTINGHGALRQLEHSYVKLPVPWSTPNPDLTWEAFDQGLMIAALVAHAQPTAAELVAGVPSHGIAIGTVEQTLPRARSYEPGKQIWEAIYELTQVIAGPDIEEVPVVATDGTCSKLAIRALQGTDRTATAVFAYGTGVANCSEFSEEPDALATETRFTSVGQPGQNEIEVVTGADEEGNPITETQFQVVAPPSYISDSAELGQVGIWEGFEGVPDVSEAITVQAHAQGEIAKYGRPPVYYSVTPNDDAPKVGPNPNPDDPAAPDCWIGDFVFAEARTDGMACAGPARLDRATFTENAQGVVKTSMELAPIALVGGD